MKLLLISKNHTRKPLKFDSRIIVGVFIFIILVTVFLTYYFTSVVTTQKIENKLENLKIDTDFVSYQKNLQRYIEQIGELNARVTELDYQTERLQGILKKQMVGKEKLPELPKKNKKLKDQGGPFINLEIRDQDVQIALQSVMKKIQLREDVYNETESILLKQTVLKDTLPNAHPINVGYRSSGYGWRIDPILGIRTFHKGLDFSAAVGDEILATASGMVMEAGKNHIYGNFLKIKHGGGIETRYAHASKLFVKKGDFVNKSDVIALVGNTGRSTGPHLHYEIRLNGRALDPRKYLKKK
jgi:murein DD-endopeptidase MepM/ murein hydrolase activator NlpD